MARSRPRSRRAPSKRSAPAAFQFTTEQIDEALNKGTHTEELKAYFGPARYEQLAEIQPDKRARGPRVLILPGIMGSTLGSKGTLLNTIIWLNPINIARGKVFELALAADGSGQHESLDAIPYYYYFLRRTLAGSGFDVDYYHFDWRKGLGTLGKELAEKLVKMSGEVNLVCHSMGGLVARAALKFDPAVTAKVPRLIMLGTPNHGSFNIVQVLTGGYDICKKIDTLDPSHSLAELTEQVFDTFPGVYHMLPFESKFGNTDVFAADQYPRTFPRPKAALLADARNVPTLLADPDPQRMFLIAGQNLETIIAAKFDPNRVTFETALTGDGAVPIRSAVLPGVKTKFVNGEHGDLPNNSEVRAKVVDLLKTEPASWVGVEPPIDRGRQAPTGRFTDVALRNAPTQVTTPPKRSGDPSAAHSYRDLSAGVFAPTMAPPAPIGEPAAVAATPATDDASLRGLAVSSRGRRRLELKLVRGSVWDLDTPAGVIGVFRNVRPEGAATALDKQMAGAVSDLVARRMFGADAGQVFILPTPGHRVGPDLAVFAGLGDFDRFNAEQQRFAAANVVRTLSRCRVDEFATVLFGSYSDGSPAEAVQSLLGGFLDGLADADPTYRFRRIIVCELDRQRYDEARRTVRRLATAGFFGAVDVYFDEEDMLPAVAVSPDRVAAGPTPGAVTYLFISGILDGKQLRLEQSVLGPTGAAAFQGRPREFPIRALEDLIKKIDLRPFDISVFGRDIAKLVLPDEVRAVLASEALKDSYLTIIHDREAARVPWEALQLDKHAPARVGGLSRRYRTELAVAKWLHRRRDDEELSILLVVNPTQDLDGAEEEIDAVRALLSDHASVRVTEVKHGDATRDRLMEEFGSGLYDVIHYAGHAAFNPNNTGQSGVLCAGEITLSGDDLAELASLPALFFCNACESGRVRGVRRAAPPPSAHKPRNSGDALTRINKSVSFAEAFLVNGISQFIGTFWPVGDASASVFATTFYGDLVAGKQVGVALLAARNAVADRKSHDWADYIHYGDPKFVLKVAPTEGG